VSRDQDKDFFPVTPAPKARHKEAETNLGHAVDASPVHLSTSVLELGENFVFDVCRQRLEILRLSVVPV